jgi:hypothetical protein
MPRSAVSWKLWSVILAAALAVGCAADPADRTVPADPGPICPTCARGIAPPTGPGMIEPTACQKSERASPIDVATARSLGFSGIDLVERDFEDSFRWTVELLEGEKGGPARGYTPLTTVKGHTKIASIEHRVPSLAGCADSLAVKLDVTFSTGDGALSISGQVESDIERGVTAPTAYGSLDLGDASGTLRLDPPPTGKTLVGRLYLSLRFWPDVVRGQGSLTVVVANEEGNDVVSLFYQPLAGHWAADDCSAIDRPLNASDPGATPDGRSAAQMVADLQRMLDTGPGKGRWDGAGPEVPVTALLGRPTAICASTTKAGGRTPYLSYRTQLNVTSGDGRIRAGGDARAWIGFDPKNAVDNAWVEVYDQQTLLAQDFAAASGISGVDFGAVPAGFWHTEIYLAEYGEVGSRAEVVVEGVDLDGKVTGTKSAVTGVITSFKWGREK